MSGDRPELGFRAAGLLGGVLVRALFLSTRLERGGSEHYERFRSEGTPVIFVFWHGQMLPLLYHHRREGVVVLVSDHADGEYVTRVIERMGFGTARGSSTRGGTKGLKGLIRAAREGHDLAVTPDGPGGPARRFKPGALLPAAVMGLPIIPVAAGATSGWRASSWDGFLIPRPLARVRIRYGPPYWIERDAGEDELAGHARVLENTLNDMTLAVETGSRVANARQREARA
jgi:lysophospholipid acyltransferase (LPLAT)-like uncharacterized protein